MSCMFVMVNVGDNRISPPLLAILLLFSVTTVFKAEQPNDDHMGGHKNQLGISSGRRGNILKLR